MIEYNKHIRTFPEILKTKADITSVSVLRVQSDRKSYLISLYMRAKNVKIKQQQDLGFLVLFCFVLLCFVCFFGLTRCVCVYFRSSKDM